MEKTESENWREKIGMEFAEIAKEKSRIETRWHKIRELDKASAKKIETAEKRHRNGSILGKIRDKILPVRKTANGKGHKIAEIQMRKMALEKKREELMRKKGELEKKKSMLKNKVFP